jgi:hypothetical protein
MLKPYSPDFLNSSIAACPAGSPLHSQLLSQTAVPTKPGMVLSQLHELVTAQLNPQTQTAHFMPAHMYETPAHL